MTWLPTNPYVFSKFDIGLRPFRGKNFEFILDLEIESGSCSGFKSCTLTEFFRSCIMPTLFNSSDRCYRFNRSFVPGNSLTEIEVFFKPIMNFKQFCQSLLFNSLVFRVKFQIATLRSSLVPA